MGKRELIALINLSSWCLMMVERLFLAVPQGCLQFVIVVFPDHTHLLFTIDSIGPSIILRSILYLLQATWINDHSSFVSLKMIILFLTLFLFVCFIVDKYDKYHFCIFSLIKFAYDKGGVMKCDFTQYTIAFLQSAIQCIHVISKGINLMRRGAVGKNHNSFLHN